MKAILGVYPKAYLSESYFWELSTLPSKTGAKSYQPTCHGSSSLHPTPAGPLSILQ
jgi:hypothetical protein